MKKKILDWIMTVFIILISIPILFFCGMVTFTLIVVLPKKSCLFLYIFSNIASVLFGTWVKNKGTFPKEGQFIFLFNHSSFIDYFLVVIAMGYKRKWTVVYGKNLHKYPIFKYFVKRIGIGVDRKSKESRIEVFGSIRESIANGFSVAIFPEGTRMRSYQMDEILLPFKNGAFSVAAELGVPMVPVVFSKPILYSKPDQPLPFSPRIIKVEYCDPIIGEKDCKILRDKVHEIMKNVLLKTF